MITQTLFSYTIVVTGIVVPVPALSKRAQITPWVKKTFKKPTLSFYYKLQFLVIENSVSRLDRLSGSQVESGFSSFQSVSGYSQQRSSTSTRSSQISHISQDSSHQTERVRINKTNV